MTPVSLNAKPIALMNAPSSTLDRRTFLNQFGLGLGGIALNEMLAKASSDDRGVLGGTHFQPKAKRIIYLFMSGGPSHLDLFDYKPVLNKRHGEQLPDSVRGGQRLGLVGIRERAALAGGSVEIETAPNAGTTLYVQIPVQREEGA